jgi:hypothetical protein
MSAFDCDKVEEGDDLHVEEEVEDDSLGSFLLFSLIEVWRSSAKQTGCS